MNHHDNPSALLYSPHGSTVTWHSTNLQQRYSTQTLLLCNRYALPSFTPQQANITKYKHLHNKPLLRNTWERAFGKEFRNLAQGNAATNTPGTDTIFVLPHNQIKQIPRDRTVTYTRIVVDYCPQKSDPNQVRLTAGGNLINYPGKLTTHTADLTTTKLL
jgi:hypothetical protein